MQISVNQEHGPHRRPVGGARTAVSSETPGRWARPTVARYASGAERCFLGFTHRRSLARSAPSLSPLPDLSSSLPAVAAVRTTHPTVAETGGTGVSVGSGVGVSVGATVAVGVLVGTVVSVSVGATVGASGGIFGLLAAALILSHRHSAGSLDRESRLRTWLWIAFIVGLGISFLPGVSMAGHVGGLIGGTLLGCIAKKTFNQ